LKQIKLTKGKLAIVDDVMFAHLSNYKWSAVRNKYGTWYAKRMVTNFIGVRCTVYLHWAVIGQPTDRNRQIVVDHIDGDGLNNRASNLRIATQRENLLNTKKRRNGKTSSRYHGVYWHKPSKIWRAALFVNGKLKHLGCFENELEAHERYKKELSLV
jgi:hypothetical protein